MSFLIHETLIYSIPLMIVALAGVFSERSGVINLALEGIMIMGAFIGVVATRSLQSLQIFAEAQKTGSWATLQLMQLAIMLIAAFAGAVFSLLLSYSAINLRADQTIGGTALNLLAPALCLFLIRVIANQNTLGMEDGSSPADWFMIKRSTLGIEPGAELDFFTETFVVKNYLATYVCILVFIIMAIILYKTRFGLRLRACGENPQAAASLGIN
ncbi:MAG: ABC transporter permease, partial [Oscillospiraceae bacterium]|nr:ABC transporter permease [Oscillospiraceae bacterium]